MNPENSNKPAEVRGELKDAGKDRSEEIELASAELTRNLIPLGELINSLMARIASNPVQERALFRPDSSGSDLVSPSWSFTCGSRTMNVSTFVASDGLRGTSLNWVSADGLWAVGLYSGPGQFTDSLVKISLRAVTDSREFGAYLICDPSDPISVDPDLSFGIEWDTNCELDPELIQPLRKLLPFAKECVEVFRSKVDEVLSNPNSDPLLARPVVRKPEHLEDVLKRFAN